MLKVVVGHSEMMDAESIVDDIYEQCVQDLGSFKPQAGMLFAAIDLEYNELLETIQERWPGLQLIGCTSDAEISSKVGFTEDSVVLVLFYSDNIEITIGVGRFASEDLDAAAKQAFDQALEGTSLPPSFCIMTPASLTFSNEKSVNAVKAVLGPDIKLFGGTAADQWQFKNTYQFYNNEVLEDTIPLIMFSGPVHVSSSAQSGWKGIGPIGTITKSEGNTVYMIDNMTALAFYKSLLGDAALPSGDRPLAILDDTEQISRLRASNETYDPKLGV